MDYRQILVDLITSGVVSSVISGVVVYLIAPHIAARLRKQEWLREQKLQSFLDLAEFIRTFQLIPHDELKNIKFKEAVALIAKVNLFIFSSELRESLNEFAARLSKSQRLRERALEVKGDKEKFQKAFQEWVNNYRKTLSMAVTLNHKLAEEVQR